jgi:hypothetical protein
VSKLYQYVQFLYFFCPFFLSFPLFFNFFHNIMI